MAQTMRSHISDGVRQRRRVCSGCDGKRSPRTAAEVTNPAKWQSRCTGDTREVPKGRPGGGGDPARATAPRQAPEGRLAANTEIDEHGAAPSVSQSPGARRVSRGKVSDRGGGGEKSTQPCRAVDAARSTTGPGAIAPVVIYGIEEGACQATRRVSIEGGAANAALHVKHAIHLTRE